MVQRRWRLDDLNAYRAGGVNGCGVNRVRVHSVDEAAVFFGWRGAGMATPSALRTAMVSSLAKPTVDAGREEVCWCLNINHWHSKALKSEAKTGYMHQSAQDKLVPG